MSKLPRRKEVDIQFTDVTYCVKNCKGKKGIKTLLKGVSGAFYSGQLTAIMGPSGAGKSTLVNVLAGYRTTCVSGEVKTNGVQRCPKLFRKQSCYIMQDDDLLPFLTVQEYMIGAATLKVKSDTAEARNQLVFDTLETLNIQHCLCTRVSNLSGGEKKRLSIALELISNTPVIFLDEPTSGLDSQNSYQVIKLLKRIAESGRNVICTIHQPSARLFEKFDALYALADGHCIYRGAVDGLVPFMSTLNLKCPSYHNPADFLVEVSSGEYGDLIQNLVAAVNCGYGVNSNSSQASNFVLDLVSCSRQIESPQTTSTESDFSSCETEKKGKSCSKKSFEPFTEDATYERLNSTHQTIDNSKSKWRINLNLLFSNANVRSKSSLKKLESGERFEERMAEESLSESNSSNGEQSDYSQRHLEYDVDAREKFLKDKDVHYVAPFSTQFWVLFKRTFLSIVRDAMLTKLRVAAHIIVGILLSILYYDIGNDAVHCLSNVAFLFFCNLFLLFTSMMPTILTFPLEMSVFYREHLNYWYSVKSYYLAKTLADLPFQILLPLLYLSSVYYFTGQPLEWRRFGLFTAFCILTSLVAQSIGLAIGASMSVQQAVFCGPSSIIPSLLFSGFFSTFTAIPVYLRWLTYLSNVRYGYEGSLLAIYGFDREPLQCSEPFCFFKHPNKLLAQLGVVDGNIWLDLGLLFLYFVILRILGFFILKYKVRKGR